MPPPSVFPLLIAIPAAVGITVLAKPVCNLLFISEDNTMLIRLSMAGSLAVVFYSLSTVTNAILQGLNHMDVPIRHAVIALVIHVAALEVFLMIFKMEIYSVVFANIIFALVMCLLNGHAIARFARYRQEYKRTLILPCNMRRIHGSGCLWGIQRHLRPASPPADERQDRSWLLWCSLQWQWPFWSMPCFFIRFRAVEEEG
ncbi:MAG: polysaccharide biosynthesis C-terminal domain-containing protein [Enterocloster clostridioformis]